MPTVYFQLAGKYCPSQGKQRALAALYLFISQTTVHSKETVAPSRTVTSKTQLNLNTFIKCSCLHRKKRGGERLNYLVIENQLLTHQESCQEIIPLFSEAQIQVNHDLCLNLCLMAAKHGNDPELGWPDLAALWVPLQVLASYLCFTSGQIFRG